MNRLNDFRDTYRGGLEATGMVLVGFGLIMVNPWFLTVIVGVLLLQWAEGDM